MNSKRKDTATTNICMKKWRRESFTAYKVISLVFIQECSQVLNYREVHNAETGEYRYGWCWMFIGKELINKYYWEYKTSL